MIYFLIFFSFPNGIQKTLNAYDVLDMTLSTLTLLSVN